MTGPFELEARNEEYSHKRSPGSLVRFTADWNGFAVSATIKGDFYTLEQSIISTRFRTFNREDVAFVVACTEQSFDGRPSWRGHYLLTPGLIGWYASHPATLIMIHSGE